MSHVCYEVNSSDGIQDNSRCLLRDRTENNKMRVKLNSLSLNQLACVTTTAH
jgi:hypothetical protein